MEPAVGRGVWKDAVIIEKPEKEKNARQTKVMGNEVTAGVPSTRLRATDRTHHFQARFARRAVLDVRGVSSIALGPGR